jgi:hypothetical protein
MVNLLRFLVNKFTRTWQGFQSKILVLESSDSGAGGGEGE